MFSKTFTTAAVALVASSLVSAQTFTDCNPLEKTCPSEPAFGNDKVNCDFTSGKCSVFEDLPGTTLKYDSKGAVFEINNGKQAPTIRTNKFIFFGRVDVELQAANGQGVVTSAVLQSADLDEIDWEWVGGDNAQVQTNYFGKGDTTTYDRGAYHDVDSPLTSFHTYSIEWTSKNIIWSVDGAPVRTLKYEDAKGGSRYPQTPMEVKLGTWVAGLKDNPDGTIEWAGGVTDFDKAPFNAWYKSVSIVDYAGSDGPSTDSVKEYIYGDKTGSWESIKVVKGEAASDEELETQTSIVAKPTTTTALSTRVAPTTTFNQAVETSEAETVTVTEDESTSSTKVKVTITSTSTLSTITTPASSTPEETSTSESATGSPTAGETTSTSTTTGDAPAQTTAEEAGASKGAMSFAGLAFAGAAVLFSLL